ncbi:tRNA-splicing endonuclease subunit Sen34 isoform X3 [Pelodiscus sinensis]|uniref:tRNA-splicing endonuclease subunit Sen34 isoform X3 n=1 Tax=Pelodiscus sinensis TaxID=13735 RepID=UPI003F6B8A73
MIQIHVLQGAALVWSAEDAREIRERFRLVGTLVGALARKPRQNTRLGLPLQLLPEEARLLAELGEAILVRSTETQPLAEGEELNQASEVEAYKQELEESYQEQQRLAGAERGALLARLADHIAEGRARRRQERGEAPGGADAGEDLGLLDSPFILPRGSMMVQLPTARCHSGRIERVDWTSPSPDWPHANCPAHEARRPPAVPCPLHRAVLPPGGSPPPLRPGGSCPPGHQRQEDRVALLPEPERHRCLHLPAVERAAVTPARPASADTVHTPNPACSPVC